MAASLLSFRLRKFDVFHPFRGLQGTAMQCRGHAKKAGGHGKNQGKPRKGKRLGMKRYEGERVIPGTVLFRQWKHKVKFHPGQNVGLGKDWSLYALVEGFVKYKKGLIQPYAWGYGQQNKFYEKSFIHVVPKKSYTGPQLVPVHDVHTIAER
ncbi:50S ribosomal protein L27-like [Acropora millepora]|uniref:50S ribosomal protein L27-like n=1 Tax=Acropora millepora TaxID=45264 RepID=UPI001CF2A339|nr:50S ribosomal protein L27-like [Acropora millepora]